MIIDHLMMIYYHFRPLQQSCFHNALHPRSVHRIVDLLLIHRTAGFITMLTSSGLPRDELQLSFCYGSKNIMRGENVIFALIVDSYPVEPQR
ncbi:hypothetical protein CDAR_508931 [Caerostris darwini]|uniref:Uncharacterized protein n=1 Tax=Caerostris darwini TaxID=1538125 RepID=A0AAV4N2Y2_9ARAC|nr:hypothetical protein CDAR_508931 [Caerostris darwini]